MLCRESRGDLKIYNTSNRYHEWALHFSLVNSAANDGAMKSTKTGYADHRANLYWMTI